MTPPNSASAWPCVNATSAVQGVVGIRDRFKELALALVAFALYDLGVWGF